jgi:hypothetical protein
MFKNSLILTGALLLFCAGYWFGDASTVPEKITARETTADNSGGNPAPLTRPEARLSMRPQAPEVQSLTSNQMAFQDGQALWSFTQAMSSTDRDRAVPVQLSAQLTALAEGQRWQLDFGAGGTAVFTVRRFEKREQRQIAQGTLSPGRADRGPPVTGFGSISVSPQSVSGHFTTNLGRFNVSGSAGRAMLVRVNQGLPSSGSEFGAFPMIPSRANQMSRTELSR